MSSTSCKARGVCSLLCVVLISYGAQTLYSVSAARLPRGGGGVAFAVADRAHPATLAGRSAALPVTFEANQGQTDPEVKFVSRGDGHTVLISPRKTIITMHSSRPSQAQVGGASGNATRLQISSLDDGLYSKSASVEMTLLGGNRSPLIEGTAQLPGKANYFVGQDSAGWHTKIPLFAGVRERSVYPGIDLVFHGSNDLEYDFVLAPAANPDSIALQFQGAGRIRLDRGDLVLSTPAGELRQPRPVAYQEIAGIRKEVASKYEIKSKGRGRLVRFRVGSYDRRLPLIIDPSLVYSGRIGSRAGLFATAVDGAGNAYITGSADPASFQVTEPQNQSGASSLAFVAKLDPNGSLVYSTMFGGSPGAGGSAVTVDAQGNAYVVGGTSSDNFPTTAGAFQTIKMASGFAGFVVKLNSSGSSLIYSTYLSGSARDTARYVAVDASGNAYVAGVPYSPDFPTTPGAFQTADNKPSLTSWGGIFVSKLNQAGSALVYSTFLDGDDGQGYDGWNMLSGVAVDSAGNAYVSGTAGSPNFPTTAGSFQPHRYGLTAKVGPEAFVTKINPSGSGLVYSTYVGDDTNGNGIAVDVHGNAYLTGSAGVDDFPAVNAIQSRIAGGLIMKTSDGGQTSGNVGSGLPPFGTSSINPVVDPSIASRVYAGLNGKLFRTDDGGASWSQIGSGLPTAGFALYSLAIDPSNSSNLFIGMRSPTSGALFASNDSGDHWHQVSTVPDGAVIAIDPKAGSTIYATTSLIHDGVATGTTVVKSNDGGNTWNPASQGLPRGLVHTIVIDPVNTSNLYAGTLAGLFKSNDAGSHWTATDARNDVRSIAIDARNPTTVYALNIKSSGQFSITESAQGRGQPKKRAAQNDELDGVIRSGDGGSTWVSINNGLFAGMSLNVLAVDPSDGTAYLGAFEGLFKSSNHGEEWAAPADLASRATFSIGVDPRNKGTLYLGGEVMLDAFVTKLAPDGASPIYSTLLGGFGQDDARCIAVDSAGNAFISGATNSGNFPVTANALQRGWSGGDDVYLAEINAAGTAILYATYVGGSDDEEPASIAVDASGNPVLTGITGSQDFPTKASAGRPFLSSTGGMFVLKIATQVSSSSGQPQITNASLSGKRLTVEGQSFDQGAVIVIAGRDLPTTNDAQEPSSMLISKKGGKRIAPGEQVIIQVRNSDGSMSNSYRYTRPSN